MKYFVDSNGNLHGQVLADEPVNPNQFRIVDLDLPMDKAHLYVLDPKLGLIPDMVKYELEQRKRRDADLSVSDRLVYPDRWERYSEDQRKLVSDYRQNLRDLPSLPDWPVIKEDLWPRMPSV